MVFLHDPLNKQSREKNMTVYNLNFQVAADTGVAITKVTATHRSTGVPSSTITVDSIPAYGYSPVTPIQSESSSLDHWTIECYIDGNFMQGNCTCAIREEDQTKTVQLRVKGDDWDVVMPVSSSCNNKSYNGL
jgi:hypothetical protein